MRTVFRLTRREMLATAGLPVAGAAGLCVRSFLLRNETTSDGSADALLDDPQFNRLKRLAGELEPLFARLAAPAPDEWLAKHPEFGQTFVEFVAWNSRKLIDRFKTLRVVSLGDLTEIQQRLFSDTEDFVERFFGFPVERLEPVPLDDLPDNAERIRESGTRQLRTSHLLDQILHPLCDQETVAVFALTARDLWDGDFNFLFGQGSMGIRVCVGSVARFGNVESDEVDYATCLRRTVGLAVHELGHVFQIPHCIAWSCRMNGSNNLDEADRRPLEFCPECLPKIWWSCGIDPAKRFERLLEFAVKHRLTRDAGLWRSACDRLRL